MATEHVFLQSVVVSSEPRFLEDRRKVPWNWDFSLFINEQWIGEKEIPNSNMIYQWSFRIPFFRIISSCMYRKHIYLLRLMDNPFHKFCSIFVCQIHVWPWTEEVYELARLNETLCKHQGLVARASSEIESPPLYRARANKPNVSHKSIVLIG